MFGELRRIANGPADAVSWRALCAMVDAMSDPHSPCYDVSALDYALDMARRWPDALREVVPHVGSPMIPLPRHGALARSASWPSFADQEQISGWWAALPEITCLARIDGQTLLDAAVMRGRVAPLRELTLSGSVYPALALLEREQPPLTALALRYSALTDDAAQRLLALSCAGSLRSLELDVIGQEALAHVLAHEHVARLDALEINSQWGQLDLGAALGGWRGPAPRAFGWEYIKELEPDALDPLASWGGALERLRIGRTMAEGQFAYHAPAALLATLGDPAAFPALVELSVWAHDVGEREAESLLEALSRRALRRLDLQLSLYHVNRVDMWEGSALAGAVESLSLSELQGAPFSALALARWPRLRELELTLVALASGGAAPLAAPGSFDRVERLTLRGCLVDDEALGQLARGLPALRELRVIDEYVVTQVSDAGFAALARSSMGSRLRALELAGGEDITLKSVALLLEPGCMPELLALDLSRTAAADDPGRDDVLQQLRRARPWLHLRCDGE